MEVIDLQDRLTYGQVYGISPERKGSGAYLPPRAFAAPTGGAARRRRGRISAEELAERNGEEPEEAYAGSRRGASWTPAKHRHLVSACRE